jgi:hypothetical protein
MSKTRAFIFDLCADIRFSRRVIAKSTDPVIVTHEKRYLIKLVAQLRELYKNRHGVSYDRYGWPELAEFNP